MELGQTDLETAEGKGIKLITIIGEIEGHDVLSGNVKTTKYEHLIPILAKVEDSNEYKGALVIINTVGGDVSAGLAIAEMIASMSKPTVSLVIGDSHSIGVPLAVSTNRSFIVPSATMTVHPVRTNGLVLGVSQTLSNLIKMQERIVNFVCKNSNISSERFRKLMLSTGELVMDIGTLLDGENAVKEGLIDCIGNLNDAMSYLYSEINKRR